ncbi:MAG: DNA polymerase II large subunit [Methanosarcinales archaeon]|nr:DNA polymerase II large subunit [Methanosarcinales archaeon]
MKKIAVSQSMKEYFTTLESELNSAIEIAANARSKGFDPKPNIEIPLAQDLADRVEKLIGIEGVAPRIRELEMNMSREEAAMHIGVDVATGKVKAFDSDTQALEAAVRVSVAMLTEGVVAAPIEGIDRVDIETNADGSKFVRIYYAGPIRSAGGTAQALSVLVADFVRRNMGIGKYVPTQNEVDRYVEEVQLYRRVASLQYTPSEEEIRLIVENCPVCIDGEPTEDAEVDGHRDLPRIPTNRVRGGMCLVMAEGLALKAPKIKKHVTNLKLDGWDWLDTFIGGGKKDDDSGNEDGVKVKPKDKYLQDLIAGRPVFSYPSRPGGFRLRYGRSRNTSFAGGGVSPATMVLMDDFLAPGTQVKVERPGKALGIAPVDSLEGPTVRLFNGNVLRVDSMEQAREVRSSISQILDIGEVLINYGDFLENNHLLVPSAYCFEWWIQELETAAEKIGKDVPYEESELTGLSGAIALDLSDTFKIPLHPQYTYLWHDVTSEDIFTLSTYVEQNGRYENAELVLPNESSIKNILETLLVQHRVNEESLHIDQAGPLVRCLGLDDSLHRVRNASVEEMPDPMDMVNHLSQLTIRMRAPYRIGSRMGRPEKSDKREMKPAPNMLFPVGDAGGRKRSMMEAKSYSKSFKENVGTFEVEIESRACTRCGATTFTRSCPDCGGPTMAKLQCPVCNIDVGEPVCPKCGHETTSADKITINFKTEYLKAFENIGERDNLTSFKGVIGLTSKNKTPEPIEKGILRAKHEVITFKDGTVRYDMSDLPLTHIRPAEIGTDVQTMHRLGYTVDMDGKELVDPSQVVELKVQDLVISHHCGEYLHRAACFIDDLLVKYYGLEPYYNASTASDLVGTLLIGLAPHTSAGVLGRLVGFTRASVGWAHPFFHAAKRRNCDGDEDCVMLLMDGLLNFSRSYLPDKRGGQMDAPLVLTTRIDPNEVDKEAHNIDLLRRYPLEFYEATMDYANPKDLEKVMDTVTGRLGSPGQYDGWGFTHDTSDIAMGPANSAYKTLGSMIEKMTGQLELARKIRAVDERDVAERVIKSHFLPDLIGNLRAFSRQKVRCVKCNRKFRRPPLLGKCPKCNGKIVLTVHEGSVKKYMEVSLQIAEEYEISDYTKQRLELLKLEIKSLFESDVSKQLGLADFM